MQKFSNDKAKIDYLKTLSFNGMSFAENNWDRKIIMPGYKFYLNSIQAHIANENLNKDLDFDLNIYHRPGLRIVGFSNKLNEIKDVFSLIKLQENKYSNSDLIMPWLGHVDILFFLAKHKNAEKVAEYYVKNFIKM